MLSHKYVIDARNLSKRYTLGGRAAIDQTFREMIQSKVTRLLDMARGFVTPLPDDDDCLWALRDVSFTVEPGEVIGIVGPNGAGKSTLLKILSEITDPTEGEAIVRGRVASLLEVGTGFHPELSGRENIYLNGTILGMTRREVASRFDAIVDFSGVEKFLDTPVKHYSSGMAVRLAFAVAAHLEPEILIIDEVLAVGDAVFQKKCLGKMQDIASGHGRTVLFVSHNMAAVRKLCGKGLLLQDGEARFFGGVEDCVSQYLGSRLIRSGTILSHLERSSSKVALSSVKVNGSTSDLVNLASNVTQLDVVVEGQLRTPLPLTLEAQVFDAEGTVLGTYSHRHVAGEMTTLPSGAFHLEASIQLPTITRGEYYLSIYLVDPGVTCYVNLPMAVRINAEGAPAPSGLVYEYTRNAGWVLLNDARNPATQQHATLRKAG